MVHFYVSEDKKMGVAKPLLNLYLQKDKMHIVLLFWLGWFFNNQNRTVPPSLATVPPLVCPPIVGTLKDGYIRKVPLPRLST
jgi:hypothetical protein